MQVLLLALYAAFYPTLLAAVVILLSQPRRLQLLSAYLAAGLTVSIGVGLGVVFAVQGSVKTSSSALSWEADLAIGGLALLAAVALATGADQRVRERRKAKRPPKDDANKRDPWSQRILARGSVPIVFAAGLVINLPGAAYLIGLKDIAAGNHSVAGKIVLVVSFNLVMFLLAEVPWVGLIAAPERTNELVERTDHWLSANGRRIALVMSALFGAFLVVRGLIHA